MKRLFLPIIVITLALVASGVRAQTENRNIYTYRNGDIWRFNLADNTATQLTEWGYNGGPILSPDGQTVAYVSATEDFVAQVNAGAATQTGGTPPTNIGVMDVASESFRLITDQTGASAAGILRSLPSWSPDGRQLAWLQLDPNAQALDEATLQIHNLDTGLTAILHSNVDLGFQGSNIRMPSLRWGGGGIARFHYTFLDNNQNPFLFIEFYDPVTGFLARYDLGLNANRDNSVRDFTWVNHLGRSLMALQIQDYWEIMDPQDGSRARLAEPPRLKNRSISGALQLIPRSVANESGGWYIHWYATTGANVYDTGYKSARVNRNFRPGLSGDGTQMAWRNGDRVSTWYVGIDEDDRDTADGGGNGWVFPIPQPFGLVWAPIEWVTTGTALAAQAAPAAPPIPSTCDLPPLLSTGQRAVVSPGFANRVRVGATLNAAAIGSIEPGAVVNIEAGPVCADGYNWYSVRNENIAGWTVEGADGEYWLLYYIDCPSSPPIRLTTNMSATVTEGRSRSIRNGVGDDNTQVETVVVAGENFDITGLPQCDAAGIRWYPVRQDQIAGWIAAGSGDKYWIEAADQTDG